MGVVNFLNVAFEGFHELLLLIVLIESIEETGDDRFFVVYAILDEIFLSEAFVASCDDLINEAASIFLLLLFFMDIVASSCCQMPENFLLGPCQFLKLLNESFEGNQNIIVHLKNCCITSSDELLYWNTLITRKNVVFEQEQNNKLKLSLKSELHNLRVIDLI